MRLTWTFCFFSDTSIVFYCICFSVLIFFSPFYLKNVLKTLSEVRLEPYNRCSTHFPRRALVLAETGAQVPLDASAPWSAGLEAGEPQHQGLRVQNRERALGSACCPGGWSVLPGGHKETPELGRAVSGQKSGLE